MRLLRQKLRKKCLVSWCAENPLTPCVVDSHTLCVCVNTLKNGVALALTPHCVR